MEYPDWVIKHKIKGTEIHERGNNYYLYKISSKWDPKKKASKKITEKFLGTITPEGLIKPKQEQFMESLNNISVKEFGATNLLLEMNKDILETLKQFYPRRWKEILVFSIFRILHNSPIKNLMNYYSTSFISETLPNAHLSPNVIGQMLRDIGKEREIMKLFLKQFLTGNDFALIDLTHVFSLSEDVISSVPGYNTKKEFLPQIRMVFLFSLDNHMPSYFRMVVGSIRDVSTLVLTVREAGIHNVVMIGDKGFFSEHNVLELGEEKIHYIFPLKRDSSLIDYINLQKGDRRAFDGYFFFEKRAVWHYEYLIKNGDLKGKKIIVFLDERLKSEEEKDYLSRIEKDDTKNLETFYENQYRQGTIAIITDLDETAERVYNLLKCRVEIEVMFDIFKNILNADRTYMRDDYQMEGWMFISFIALVFYYKLYRILSDNMLLKRYSPMDVLVHLSRVYKLKIQDRWLLSEIPKKSRELIEKLSIPITHK
jgi:transposase